ncbi:MAG TPA: hypothetical protein VKO67_05670, partial [Smithellaceae bacterium]|nr:hypothetical protein [Smithellaceae bacterium]
SINVVCAIVFPDIVFPDNIRYCPFHFYGGEGRERVPEKYVGGIPYNPDTLSLTTGEQEGYLTA